MRFYRRAFALDMGRNATQRSRSCDAAVADTCDGMDRAATGSRPAATSAANALQGVHVATDGDLRDVSVRVVPVAVGDRIRATVAQIEQGFVWLGYRGSVFAAKADAELQPGQSYDFEVTRVEPHVQLALVRGAAAGSASDAEYASLSGKSLAKSLIALARSLPTRTSVDGGEADAFVAALDTWARGDASAHALRSITKLLGHDLEARVLTLANPDGIAGSQQDAASLRDTAKAHALQLLEDESAAPKPKQEAAQFVAAMHTQERDNAARADARLPMWTPLPACPAAGLTDARMFFLAHDREAAPQRLDRDQETFTAALLLDFTSLGALRVDVEVGDGGVQATFLATKAETAAMLHSALPELATSLQATGLTVKGLRAMRVAGALPIADLAPLRRDGKALVDVHV